MNNLQSFQKRLAAKPQLIFLVDGTAAFLSAFTMGLLLPIFKDSLGIPLEFMQILALIACGFCAYSFLCFFVIRRYWRPFVAIIILLNISYAALSMGLSFYLYGEISSLGIAYLMLEIIAIGAVVLLEMWVFRGGKI